MGSRRRAAFSHKAGGLTAAPRSRILFLNARRPGKRRNRPGKPSALSGVLPSCPFHRLTGLYCPGCGNTRSVLALMDGDLLLSLRYNISPLLILTLLALLYAEWGFRLFARPKRLLPRSARFWILFGVAVGGYLIIRNFFPMPAAV